MNAKMPNNFSHVVDAQFDVAKAMWQCNEVRRAEALLRKLCAREPAREDMGMLLAEILRSQGNVSAAALVVLGVCRANSFEPSLCLRAARFVQQCDRHVVATQICDGALAHGVVPPELQVQAGHIARESGDFQTARRYYLAALDAGIDLEKHHVLVALANTKRYKDPADPIVARCARHFSDRAFSVRSRASAGFGLAKVQDDLGDYKSAAVTLREANALVRMAQPWDGTKWRSFVAARTAERVARGGGESTPGFVPVFVVGLPRAGTTLAATLLARSSDARDRGELRVLRFIADQMITSGHLDSRAGVAEAAALYRSLARQDDAPASWYIDQDPMNFRYLHLASAMFPQMRVIHCRRDRRDTKLSLWSQDFAHPDMAFAYDFNDIADYAAGHDDLMRHWKRSLPLAIYDLDYEALVAEPERTLASLRAFIGIAVRDAETTSSATPIQSASVWQARQPIYKTSVGRWRRYVAYVPELEQDGHG